MDIPSPTYNYEQLDTKWNGKAEHRYGTDEITKLQAGGVMISLKDGRAQRLILEVDDEDDNLFANILRLSCVNIQT